MQNRFKRSNLELRGPRNGLKSGPRGSRGVCSAPFPAQNPDLPTTAWPEWIRRGESAQSHTQIRNAPIRNPCNPLPLVREGPVRAALGELAVPGSHAGRLGRRS
eukprot:11428708-Alexandrium_andersonii.AAC.1